MCCAAKASLGNTSSMPSQRGTACRPRGVAGRRPDLEHSRREQIPNAAVGLGPDQAPQCSPFLPIVQQRRGDGVGE
eukprot:581421-Pyramimonas_sp.AAC.1